MKTRRTPSVEHVPAEYNFDYSKAERGKYFKRLLKEGSNVVVLERDVAKAFPNSAAVNKALRSVMKSRKRRRTCRPRSETSCGTRSAAAQGREPHL